MQILTIVSPIFLIIGLGYVLRHFRVINDTAIHALNGFVYYVSLPAVILVSFWQIDWYDPKILVILGFNILSIVIFSAIIIAILHLFRMRGTMRAAIFSSALVGNTVYMGFPLGKTALGADNFSEFVSAATPHLVIGIAFAILAVEFFAIRSRNVKAYVVDFMKNPLIIALFFGIALSLLRLDSAVTDLIGTPLDMLGKTASPLALVALGAFIYGKFVRKHFERTLLVSLLKLIGLPAVVFVLSRLLGLGHIAASASVLAGAMPTAVTVFVISEKYKIEPEAVANDILISTVVSLFTISALLLLL